MSRENRLEKGGHESSIGLQLEKGHRSLEAEVTAQIRSTEPAQDQQAATNRKETLLAIAQAGCVEAIIADLEFISPEERKALLPYLVRSAAPGDALEKVLDYAKDEVQAPYTEEHLHFLTESIQRGKLAAVREKVDNVIHYISEYHEIVPGLSALLLAVAKQEPERVLGYYEENRHLPMSQSVLIHCIEAGHVDKVLDIVKKNWLQLSDRKPEFTAYVLRAAVLAGAGEKLFSALHTLSTFHFEHYKQVFEALIQQGFHAFVMDWMRRKGVHMYSDENIARDLRFELARRVPADRADIFQEPMLFDGRSIQNPQFVNYVKVLLQTQQPEKAAEMVQEDISNWQWDDPAVRSLIRDFLEAKPIPEAIAGWVTAQDIDPVDPKNERVLPLLARLDQGYVQGVYDKVLASINGAPFNGQIKEFLFRAARKLGRSEKVRELISLESLGNYEYLYRLAEYSGVYSQAEIYDFRMVQQEQELLQGERVGSILKRQVVKTVYDQLRAALYQDMNTVKQLKDTYGRFADSCTQAQAQVVMSAVGHYGPLHPRTIEIVQKLESGEAVTVDLDGVHVRVIGDEVERSLDSDIQPDEQTLLLNIEDCCIPRNVLPLSRRAYDAIVSDSARGWEDPVREQYFVVQSMLDLAQRRLRKELHRNGVKIDKRALDNAVVYTYVDYKGNEHYDEAAYMANPQEYRIEAKIDPIALVQHLRRNAA